MHSKKQDIANIEIEKANFCFFFFFFQLLDNGSVVSQTIMLKNRVFISLSLIFDW